MTKGNPTILNNMNETVRHYAKSNKSVTEGQILPHSSFKRHLKQSNI